MENIKEKNTYDVEKFAQRLNFQILPDLFKTLRPPNLWRDLAYTKLILLNKRIEFGVRMLVNAYRKDHINPITMKPEDQLWIRSMYLESAIETYNKVEDYVYSIIYFCFNLDSKDILIRDDVINFSKGKYIKKDVIDNWLNNNNETDQFYILLQNYKSFVYENKIKANDLKHWGCYKIKGLEIPVPDIRYSVRGIEIKYRDIINGSPLEIDLEIENLINIHKETIVLIDELFNICFRKLLK